MDEDQQEIMELKAAKHKMDKGIESLHERIGELKAENHKIACSNKKVKKEQFTFTEYSYFTGF